MKDRGIRSGRPDGRFRTLGGLVHHRLKTLRPALAFDPSWNVAEMDAWRQGVRRRLRQVLAMPRPPKQPAPKMIDDHPRDGYRLQRWELYPEPDSVVPMLMLVPDGASRAKPAGAVICMPGSEHPLERLAGEPEPEGSGPNLHPEHNPMGLHFVRRGLVALCIENPGTGSMAEPLVADWMRQSWELVWMGRNYEGLSTFHKLVAFRWLRTLPMVDADRISACGHSLGGKTALLLGVLEPSVAAVVWNSAAYSYRRMFVHTNLERIAPWQYIPGFIRWFDYPDLMAALAPTPLLLSEGGRTEELRGIRKAYKTAGAPGALKVSYVPNCRRAADRPLDRKPLPDVVPHGDYARHLNTDNSQHRFQYDVVVPWVVRKLAAR